MWIAGVKVGAVMITAGLAVSACGQRESAPGAAGDSPAARTLDVCPDRHLGSGKQPWVPAPPMAAAEDRLVPDADPVEAVVCRYRALGGEADELGADSGGLEGEVRLEGGLSRVRTDLLWPAEVEGSQRVCTTTGGSLTPYLVRLRYPGGVVWLSTVQEANGCSPTGNGAFVSAVPSADHWAQAYGSASWPAPGADPCRTRTGRSGEERSLVPHGWTTLLVCGEDGSRREVGADRAGRIADLLDRVQTRPGTNACSGQPTIVERLVFTHAEGPPAVVTYMPGCEPSVGNGSLSASLTPEQSDVLAALVQ